MATATVTDGPRVSVWTRVTERLSSWGKKITNVAVKGWDYISRGAKWLYNSKAAQWVVAKSKILWSKAWHLAKGPVGWIAAPIAGIIFAPKAVAVMLFLVLLIVAFIAIVVWAMWRSVKDVSTPEQVDEMVDAMQEAKDEFVTQLREQGRMYRRDRMSVVDDVVDAEIIDTEIDTPLDADETLDARHGYLDGLHDKCDPMTATGRCSPTDRPDASPGGSGPEGASTTPSSTPNASVSDIYRDCKTQGEKPAEERGLRRHPRVRVGLRPDVERDPFRGQATPRCRRAEGEAGQPDFRLTSTTKEGERTTGPLPLLP